MHFMQLERDPQQQRERRGDASLLHFLLSLDRVSLCSPTFPGTCSEDQVYLELTDTPASLCLPCAGITWTS